MIIATDFDGTLHFPIPGRRGIGRPNTPLIQKLIELRANNNDVILWTCREGDNLDEAVQWCKAQGLEFDAINDNIPRIKEEHLQRFGTLGRKIYADVYVDDRASSPREFVVWF